MTSASFQGAVLKELGWTGRKSVVRFVFDILMGKEAVRPGLTRVMYGNAEREDLGGSR